MNIQKGNTKSENECSIYGCDGYTSDAKGLTWCSSCIDDMKIQTHTSLVIAKALLMKDGIKYLLRIGL